MISAFLDLWTILPHIDYASAEHLSMYLTLMFFVQLAPRFIWSAIDLESTVSDSFGFIFHWHLEVIFFQKKLIAETVTMHLTVCNKKHNQHFCSGLAVQ